MRLPTGESLVHENGVDMNVIDLSRIDRSMIGSVGAKAAGLGEMLAAGEAVPPGFCVTTEAYRSGSLPGRELTDAVRTLGDGPVAIRSSATAEDQPAASFAGQQDTYLNVTGTADVRAAIRRCWESLRTERAVAYRSDHQISEDGLAMAVVVQRMVDARVAGVLFTANPLTGCRTQAVVDAAPGLGTSVVDGTVVPDHYVMDGPDTSVRSRPDAERPRESGDDVGSLSSDQRAELWHAGQRLQRLFGCPQDIEWAFDRDGTLWLLQARPITTLFPLPSDNRPGTRAYLEVGHLQGMLRPMTPMGLASMHRAMALWCEDYGIPADRYAGHPGFVDVGGRMFIDLTSSLQSARLRKRLPTTVQAYGPRVTAAVEHLMSDPRFGPQRARPFRLGTVTRVVARAVPSAVGGIVGALARPVRARERAFESVAKLSKEASIPAGLDTARRLRRAEDLQGSVMNADLGGVMWPVIAAVLVGQLPGVFLNGLGTEDEFGRIAGGLAHNVTTEMDIRLWRIAEGAREHRSLLLDTPPEELATRYRNGELPDIGLDDFLARYGHRAAAEVDVGVPRWADDPTPLFATIANYLRVTDPEQSPERRFERAAAEAEATIAELTRRARRRPVRGRLAVFFMRRVRELGGLRELGKFAWLLVLAGVRACLLSVGEDLVAHGVLRRPDDVMFLDYPEVWQAIEGRDQRELVAHRRATYERELRRSAVPLLLLSDGTDVEATVPRKTDAPPGTLVGLAAAPGAATGQARVVHDPTSAQLEPGEILVARTTDPGWTPLFMSAAGLVTETGALVAHGPTVAREYGLPAVICVRDATTAIHTGQTITVDGIAGTVRIEDDQAAQPAEGAGDVGQNHVAGEGDGG